MNKADRVAAVALVPVPVVAVAAVAAAGAGKRTVAVLLIGVMVAVTAALVVLLGQWYRAQRERVVEGEWVHVTQDEIDTEELRLGPGTA